MSAPPKRILIVGGVAGGMSCATRLRRLDEHAAITVVEKGSYVSYANCGIPYALGGVVEYESKLHVQTVGKLQSWFNLDIRVNTALVRIQRSEKSATLCDLATNAESTVTYDKLVLAMGAEAFVPPVKGARLDHVHTLQTIPDLQAIQAVLAGRQRAVQRRSSAAVSSAWRRRRTYGGSDSLEGNYGVHKPYKH